MRYSLRQLEVFLAVARLGSVNAAARALHLSQSATSAALIALERQFDVQLFERRGKRLLPSALGESLRPRAEELWARAEELERALAGAAPVGPLRLGATLTIGSYVAPPLIAEFLRRYPGAQVSLAMANTREIARRVANFELDLALIEGDVVHPRLESLPWRRDTLTVFCAPSHPLARRRRLRDADLLAARWIVREPGSGTRQTFERALSDLLPHLHIAMELEHAEAIKAAVLAGLGVGCVSQLALRDDLARGALHACRVPGRDFSRNFYLLVRRQSYRGPSVTAWQQLCRQGTRDA